MEDNFESPLIELTKLTTIDGWSLILSSSSEEAARYIETFKAYENKSSESIQEVNP